MLRVVCMRPRARARVYVCVFGQVCVCVSLCVCVCETSVELLPEYLHPEKWLMAGW